ncbi:hypothetical protein NB640_12405 [Oxalobacter vibrioformis]|uniref:N-acetyltransferase domain-containing protein n=1 Tax=Oxalobacter vibrioformis TaxID=933080 RepID=A0A9E9P2K7_9BURK|nr:hypothetical protein [Oxalobacter vibrioformis]WAW10002.1 hypothetical protein NB640_12405 [Oxalobacter vibrioformis]
MAIVFESPTQEHLEKLSVNLRDVDKVELTHSHGGDILLTLQESVESSEVALVAVKDGEPITIFGISRVPEGGVIWMVGTDEMYAHKRLIYLIGKTWSMSMLPHYGYLFNYVHLENRVTLRWLERIGYERGEIVENYGEGTEPFIRMSIKQD